MNRNRVPGTPAIQRGARMAQLGRIQPALSYAATHLDEDLSLEALAGHAGLSAFHLHRVFSAACGESPKQLALRLRLERAAALLLVTQDSILEVALACGFQSHEVFLRAFRRRFGVVPSHYRQRGFALPGVGAEQVERHAALVEQVGVCIRLYHIREERRTESMYSISLKELEPQPALVLQRRVKSSDIGAALAEMLPYVFMHAQQSGMVLAGQPFTRYLEWGPGMVTIEAGMPVATGAAAQPAAAGELEVLMVTLPGGRAATTIHAGPYEQLPEAHAALQQWIETEGLTAAGAPWEVYVTDPADFPDPGDWKTEVLWPVT